MRKDNVTASSPSVSLQCLGGAPVPPAVVEGWRGLIRFPEESYPGFWELLGAVVMEPEDPHYQSKLESFCQDQKLELQPVLRALQACDFLLASATTINLDPKLFLKDLTTLSNGETSVPDDLLNHYQAALPHLRNRLIEATLADHGKLLTGLDWRVDNVTTSDRGTQLNSTVIYLTLRYREGDNQDRLTLQLTPAGMKQLKAFTDRFGA